MHNLQRRVFSPFFHHALAVSSCENNEKKITGLNPSASSQPNIAQSQPPFPLFAALLGGSTTKPVSRYYTAMPKDIEIVCGRYIGDDQPCFVIAEIGQNHQGDIEIAKQLIKTAKECGADCVKLQKSCLKEKFTTGALSRIYEGPNSWGKTYGEHKEHLEFNIKQIKELQDYAEKIVGIPFTASAMDWVSADELESLDVPFIKIGSGDTDNFPLLEHVAKKKRNLVLSTGMQELWVVEEAYNIITKHLASFVMLQCTSAYPTPPSEANLRVMEDYRARFPKAHIGLSCHEDGIAISIAAVALGAKVLERHITLSKTLRGSDHACSLEPQGLRDLIQAVRCVEVAMGSPQKSFLQCELPCKQKLGKSLVASKSLSKGTKLNPERDICIKVSEPQGIPASQYYLVKDCILLKNINIDEPIMASDVERVHNDDDSIKNLSIH
ncbi:sialic acid synthase isoform X2 [Cloeon dipterum]|uniref:sialic acid synthase isoform X2 n=1 Tax=Cloeon dipterum TaxID=197152 RepID=UPI0032201A08